MALGVFSAAAQRYRNSMPTRDIAELEVRLAEASAPPVDSKRRVDALNALAWELRAKDPARGHALAVEARELAALSGYILGQARATRTMAMTIADREQLGAVFRLAEEAKRLFDEANDATGRAGSRDFLASLYEFVGDLAAGLELALDALAIARETGDPVRQGYALSSVGGILAASGDPRAAVERLNEALALFEGVSDLQGISTICTRLCRVFEQAGEREKALEYAERCRATAELTGDEYARWSALTVMARLEKERGHHGEAERLYRAALGSWSWQLGRDLFGVETQVDLGRLLLERGALDEAEREIEDGLGRVLGNSLSRRHEAAAHEALAELCERRGALPKALEHMRKAHELRGELAQQDARSKLAQVELRASLAAARKDAEIHKLRFVELHGMQSQLASAEKTALLAKLAAGMTHELNTPLGVLRSNAKLITAATRRLDVLLAASGELGDEAKKLAAALVASAATTDEATQRIGTIAENIRRFAELDEAERRHFDVRQSVSSALSLLEPTLTENIRVERRLDPVPAVDGWPREVNQALLTVLQNAVDAIDGAGVVTVETSATEEHVLVRIRDNGRGMSEEQARHLFDVAWSRGGTRAKMRLGLSAALATVHKHKGDIHVESAPGRGTALTFRFPIAKPAS